METSFYFLILSYLMDTSFFPPNFVLLNGD